MRFKAFDKESGNTFTFGFEDLYGWDYGDVYIRNESGDITLVYPPDINSEFGYLNPNLVITLE